MRIWLLVPLQRDLFRRPWKAHWLSTTSYYFHRLRNRWPCTLIFGRTSVAYGFNTPYRLWHAAAGIELSSSRRRKRRVLARPELIFQFFLPRAGFELGTRQRNPKRDYEAAALPLCYLTTCTGTEGKESQAIQKKGILLKQFSRKRNCGNRMGLMQG